MEKQKVFIPVDIFDKETVGIVSIPTKNDCYVKEEELYCFDSIQLNNFVRNILDRGEIIGQTGYTKRFLSMIKIISLPH